MWPQIALTLLCLFCSNSTFQHCFAIAHEFAAFADFLRWQQLQHAIVAATNNAAMRKDAALHALLNEFHVHFFEAATMRIAFADNCCYYNSPRVGIYLAPLEDVSLQRQVLLSATDGDIFNNTQAWFIVSAARRKEEAHANVQRIMTQLPLNVSADITLAARGENNTQLLLFDIYKLQRNRLEIMEKGSWHKENGLNINSYFQRSFVQRRRNLAGLVLRAGTPLLEQPVGVDGIPYLQNNKDYKNLDVMQRKTYQLMMLMEPMHNVTFQINFYNGWGALDANGSWTGVMAHLITHQLEFAMTPMRFTPDRFGYIQYSLEIHTEYIIALTAVAMLLLAVYLQHERRLRLQPTHAEHSFDYVMLIVLEAVFMQGPSPSAFNAASTRLHVVCICLFSLLLLQFYSAFIVGSLLALAPRTITTLEALYNSSLEIGMENIPYNFEIFMNVTNRVARAIYTQRICKDRSRHILSIEEGAARIQQGGFAFHVSANRMYTMLQQHLSEAEFCDLQEITFNSPFHSPIALRRNSPFREHFAQAALRFRTSGLLQYNDKQWQIPKLDCSLSQANEVEVDLEHFIPALVLLAAAMLLSVIVLLFEFLIDVGKRKWKLMKLRQ